MGGLESRYDITVFVLESFEIVDLEFLILESGDFALQFFLIGHGLLWIVLKR